MTKKKKETQETATYTEPIAIDATAEQDIRGMLEEIKNYEGVVGYILRNTTSAAIDLKDPTKIIDYAILSSASIDAGQELSELFNLGSMKHVVVEGKHTKMLSFTVDENRISIFMEKNADTE
ncbi:MAG: hypothetical protein QXJ02_01040, partial [Candidatus Bathyarchaeia archaeon]